MNNIFGTDGVRGKANDGYITPENVMKLAISAVNYYVNDDHKTANSKFTVVIGKDTRLSGYMLEPALTSGFISAGADVVLLGPVPTPAVAFLTRSLRADLGVVISASHNPYYDNGIKFFNSKGFKISPKDETKISVIFHNRQTLTAPDHMGKAKRLNDAAGRYIELVKNSFPKNLGLLGMKIVIDTANGAAYKIAPQVLWELGAEIIKIGSEPDGLNINKFCGATDTKLLQKTVVDQKADIGIALDGDADRLIIVDEKGEVLDGDYIIATIATDWLETGKLSSKNVVATKMSNIGMEIYLNKIGLKLFRCDVGDKYVLEKMLEIDAKIGGEKSGHIIPIDYSSTGDGIVAALQILAYIRRKEVKASDIRNLYSPFPQEFKNVTKIVEVSDEKTVKFIKEIESEILKEKGRIIIRKSGTENLIRIMIESENREDINLAMKKVEELFVA
ncbi:MAG: phosphoglucosamine mutase [Holosporales bacterium]|jgi:phosphoglucosamine mutase|nr:phosphoglucosamine mutase [Holosporales bacterium]